MKNFISSQNIQVYPTAYREGYNPTSSLNTEYNITTLITRLTDKDSFVIHANKVNNKIKDIWFSLLGYWFYADITELYDEDYPYYSHYEEKYDYTLYANIEIVNNSYEGDSFIVPSLANYTQNTVTVLDDADGFKGVKFTQSPDTESGKTIYSLKIIDKDGNIPEESFIKIGTHAIANTKYENNIPSIENEASLNRLLKVDVNDSENNGLLIKNGNDILEQTTKTKKDINVPVNLNGDTSITGKTTVSGNVDIAVNTVISGDININNQETGFKVSGGSTSLKDLNVQANVSVGESDYSGDIKIKSKKNLTVAGESSEAQTIKFDGTSEFQGGDYSSTSTSGSESIKVGGKSFNVVTRDTTQTISGVKTFTSQPKIRQQNVDQPIATEKWVDDRYLKNVGNFGGSDQLSRIETYYAQRNQMPFYVKYNSTVYRCCWLSGLNTQQSSTIFLYFTSEKDLITYRIDYNAYKTQTFTQTFDNYTNASVVNTATTTHLGLVKSSTTGTTANRDYNVEVSSEGTMKVNVPWAQPNNNTISLVEGAEGMQGNIELGEFTLDQNSDKTIYVNRRTYNFSNSTTQGRFTVTPSTNGVPGTPINIDLTNLGTSGNPTFATVTTSSDKRLKENVKKFESRGNILELPVVEFDFIDNHKHSIGCIAQDLKEICSEIVHENSNGYLTIEESKIVYLLLNEVKKLRKELDELKGK